MKGPRLFHVPCCRPGCAGYSFRTPSDIQRQQRQRKRMGCCLACSKWDPESEWTCYHCKGTFYLPASQVKNPERPFCSKDCYTAWQMTEENGGANHPNYTGGTQDRNCKRQEYRRWRERVFARDSHTCQICGARGVYQQAHHIIAYALRPDLELDPDNGVTLCRTCHKQVHATCGLLCDSTDYIESHRRGTR